jgi:hypothetical protein
MGLQGRGEISQGGVAQGERGKSIEERRGHGFWRYPTGVNPAGACLLPQLFSALQGEMPPIHPHMLEAPTELQLSVLPPPSPAKDHIGAGYEHMLDTQNFSITWWDGAATEAIAQVAAEALEEAWEALVETRDWPQPPSSEDYLVWVILDPSISGTGFTTIHSMNNGETYTVIYVNPDNANHETFFRSLCAHEFNHAIQWGLRYWSGQGDEPWYWEASAEWGAELALPELNAYAEQSWWYAQHPEYRYAATWDYHQYGMFLVNAFLEEHITGDGGMLDTWLLAEEEPTLLWDEILAQSSGLSVSNFWAAFSAVVGAGDLREFDLYYAPIRSATLVDKHRDTLGYLGTHYMDALEDQEVRVTGEALLSSPEGWGDTVRVRSGQTLAVTGTSAVASEYQLLVSPWQEGDSSSSETPSLSACACGSTQRPSALGPWFLLVLALVRRRSPQQIQGLAIVRLDRQELLG